MTKPQFSRTTNGIGESYDLFSSCPVCQEIVKQFPEDAAWQRRKCSVCPTNQHQSPSNEGIPEPRREGDRAKPKTVEGLIKETERILKNPRPQYPSILGHVLSPQEAEINRQRREKENVENWRLEHGLGPTPPPPDPNPTTLGSMFKFRRPGEEPPEKPQSSTKEVVEKAREIQIGYGFTRDPELKALIARREQLQDQIKRYEVGKQFDKQHPPAYVKKLMEKMSYTQAQEHLQAQYERLKKERENQEPNVR